MADMSNDPVAELAGEELQGRVARDAKREAAIWAFKTEIEAADCASVNLFRRLEKMKLLVLKAMWAQPLHLSRVLWWIARHINKNAKARREKLVELRHAVKVLVFEEFFLKRVRTFNRRLALLDLVEVRGLLLDELLLDFKDDFIPLDAVVNALKGLDKAKNVFEASLHDGCAGGDFNGSAHAKHYTTEAQGNA